MRHPQEVRTIVAVKMSAELIATIDSFCEQHQVSRSVAIRGMLVVAATRANEVSAVLAAATAIL